MPLPNTENVKLNEFPAIEAGWYELILKETQEKTSKAGDKYTKLTFDIEGQSGKAWGNLSHLEQALWKVKQFKVAIGMPDDETYIQDYISSRLQGYCQNDEYKGKNYTIVTEYKALEASRPKSEPATSTKKDDDGLPF